MKKKTSAQKRAGAQERKYIDRAILRLTRTFHNAENAKSLSESEHRELMGLVMARRRVP
jgi:hypothetical protein